MLSRNSITWDTAALRAHDGDNIGVEGAGTLLHRFLRLDGP
jgi:hypothetical protein